MAFCMLQKTNMKAALCIINKLGQEHLITTAKTLYLEKKSLKAGTRQGEKIHVSNFSYAFSLFLLEILIRVFIP